MSHAYKQRQKAIKRGLWDFSAQHRRQGKIDPRAELQKGITPGTLYEFPYHVRHGRYLVTKGMGHPRSQRWGRRFPRWLIEAKRNLGKARPTLERIGALMGYQTSAADRGPTIATRGTR